MEVLAVENGDFPMLLNQLSGYLIDVTVFVINCYSPNSVPAESGLLFSHCLPLKDFSQMYCGKEELLDVERFRQNCTSVSCRLLCLAERVFLKQGDEKTTS